MPIPVVVGMVGDGRVAELSSRRGWWRAHRLVARAVPDGISSMSEGRGRRGRRVDDPFGPVDGPVIVPPLDDRADRAGAPIVQVNASRDRSTLSPRLAKDSAAGFGRRLPSAFDDVLGGDAGVVDAGRPKRLRPLHSAPPDGCVPDRLTQRMSYMQRSGHVWRGLTIENEGAGRVAGWVRREEVRKRSSVRRVCFQLPRARAASNSTARSMDSVTGGESSEDVRRLPHLGLGN
jgi:hypothetical protein